MPDDDTLRFLREETARMNASQDEWVAKYGFTHDCRCDLDYEMDNVGSVTDCWAKMCDDALETCANQRTVLKKIANGESSDPVALAQEYILGR